jgi:hypothetical protein
VDDESGLGHLGSEEIKSGRWRTARIGATPTETAKCLKCPIGPIGGSTPGAEELFPRVGFIVTNLETPSRGVVRFYNRRGTAEQWIKEGKQRRR